MMLSVYLLFIELLILFLISFVILFNRDIFSPSVMICISFILSTIVLGINVDYWDAEIDSITIIIIGTAIMIAMTTELIVLSLAKKGRRKQKYLDKDMGIGIFKKRYLSMNKYLFVLLIIFSLVEMTYFWKEVIRIGAIAESYGYHGTIMFNYRQITAHSTELVAEDMMNSFVVQGFKMVMVFAHVSMYIFINNVIIFKGKFTKNGKYLLPVIIYLIQTIMNASRIPLIYFGIYVLFISYILLSNKTFWVKNLSSKFIRLGTIALCIIFSVFTSLNQVVGRMTDNTAFETISVYLGAPILLLNQFLTRHPFDNIYFGQETLPNLYKSLYKLGLVSSYPSFQTEFGYSNGHDLGNVYTFLRRPMQDFGYIGMLLITILVVGLYSYIYYFKIKYKPLNSKSELSLFMYAYLVYPIPLFSIDFTVYSFFTFGTIFTLLYLNLGFKLFIRRDFINDG